MATLITPPTALPISVAEAKEALRISSNDDDVLLEGMIAAATRFVERRADLALMLQTWQITCPTPSPALITLRPKPLHSVISIAHIAATDRTRTELSSDDYQVNTERGVVRLSSFLAGPGSIEVTFQAGHQTQSAIPDDLLRAVYLLTAHYYEERELFRDESYVSVPHSIEALLASYREVRL